MNDEPPPPEIVTLDNGDSPIATVVIAIAIGLSMGLLVAILAVWVLM